MNSFFSNVSPRLLLFFTALLWSSGGLLIKGVNLHPITVSGFRSFFAFIFLIATLGCGKFENSWKFWGSLFSYAGTVICFTVATKWTTAANAILLQSTAPIYVALLSSFYLNEKLDKLDYLALVGVICGLFFFFQGDINLVEMRGNVMGLVAGAFFGLFIVLTRKGGESTAVSAVVWGNLLAALVALPALIPLSSPAHDTFANESGPLFPNFQDLWRLLVAGFFQLGLPYFLYSQAIGRVRAIDATLILLLEPILNPIWVFIFLGEKPSGWALFGGSLVLLAATSKSLLRSRLVSKGA